LTILDQGEGRITGVRYNSATPLEQQLNTLHLTLARDITYADLLTALRGSRVEVRDKAVATTGRILAVEDREVPQGENKPSLKQTLFSVITDAGDARSFVVSPALTVKPLEGDIREDLGRYLQMLAAARAQDLRRMTVSAQGSRARDLFVSYISEVPVWKTSYRILLPEDPKKPALLQGWAIVDNTVGEDWTNVQLSLVSGAPQSFVQNLSQPYYVRRPQIALPETAMLTPQSHESGTPAPPPPQVAVSTDTVEVTAEAAPSGGPHRSFDRLEQYSKLSSPPRGALGGVVGGIVGNAPSASAGGVFQTRSGQNITGGVIGAGSGGGVGSGAFHPSPPPPPPSLYDAVSERLPSAESATTQELGGLFEYTIKDRVSVAKNQSALVPILNSRISAEHVTLWNADQPTPLRAIWLENTSGETLDGGSFSILDANAFAGEGIFDTIRPKEKRLLSYAADDAVHISREGERTRKPLRHLRIANGVMTETAEERETATYTVRNSDTHPRDVILEHPKPANWKLANDAKPEETTADLERFRVKVAPGETATLKVEMVHPLLTTERLIDQNDDTLALLVKHLSSESTLTHKLKPVSTNAPN
ncbi:MAG: DUF4139 domain-containing protein, partial [Acidobacteriales bacterium]|nr:DUF4139 domain-containing protein [Terriglobales bacterium]